MNYRKADTRCEAARHSKLMYVSNQKVWVWGAPLSGEAGATRWEERAHTCLPHKKKDINECPWCIYGKNWEEEMMMIAEVLFLITSHG